MPISCFENKTYNFIHVRWQLISNICPIVVQYWTTIGHILKFQLNLSNQNTWGWFSSKNAHFMFWELIFSRPSYCQAWTVIGNSVCLLVTICVSSSSSAHRQDGPHVYYTAMTHDDPHFFYVGHLKFQRKWSKKCFFSAVFLDHLDFWWGWLPH